MSTEFKVDPCDEHLLREYKWCDSGHGYAKSWDRKAKKFVYLHRLIMQPANGMVVDHINGDRSDNRRANLRVVTRGENLLNGGKFKCRAAHVVYSKHRGVAWLSHCNRWAASFRSKYLGSFEDEDSAARAYNHAARESGIKTVRLNSVGGAT